MATTTDTALRSLERSTDPIARQALPGLRSRAGLCPGCGAKPHHSTGAVARGPFRGLLMGVDASGEWGFWVCGSGRQRYLRVDDPCGNTVVWRAPSHATEERWAARVTRSRSDLKFADECFPSARDALTENKRVSPKRREAAREALRAAHGRALVPLEDFLRAEGFSAYRSAPGEVCVADSAFDPNAPEATANTPASDPVYVTWCMESGGWSVEDHERVSMLVAHTRTNLVAALRDVGCRTGAPCDACDGSGYIEGDGLCMTCDGLGRQ